MKAHISITDDLADVFIIQALKEGYCNHLTGRTQERRNRHAEYMLHQSKLDNIEYAERFDRISQLILMYDEIELPILNTSYGLTGKIEQIARIREDMPAWFYSNEQLSREELSDDDAMKLKPIIMSAIKNINFREHYLSYIIERNSSIGKHYSTVYDMMYNHASGVFDEHLKSDAISGYSMLANHISISPDSPESCILYTHKVIITLVKNLLLYFSLNTLHECDYYSKVFADFSSEVNVNAAYGMVKTQISYIMEQQPAFESLSEIMTFKEKRKKELHDLREVVSSLEILLKKGSCEAAIQKAISDVRSANESLIKNTPTKRIAQIATYISVPISVVELLAFGTPFSMIIGVVGTIAQLTTDMNSKQSDWLFVAR